MAHRSEAYPGRMGAPDGIYRRFLWWDGGERLMIEIPPPRDKRGYYSKEVAALSGMSPKRVNEIVRAGIITPSIRRAPRMGVSSLWARSDIEAIKKISDVLKSLNAIQKSTGVRFRVAP